MKKLYEKDNIGSMELKNKWIMLAVHTGFSENGFFSQRDIEFYRRRANGGMAAITLVGGVSKAGESNCMNMLDDDKYDEKIKETVDAIHDGDCKVIMQLYHAGRNNRTAVNGIQPMAPSAIPSPIYKEIPKEMTEEDIKEVIEQFASAASRCKRLGVDCVEVSASVGYLISEFFSPITNQRNDFWGGDEIKRMRFPTEVLKSIRKAVGEEYPVIIKISGGDMLGGYDCDYMARFINQLPAGTINGVTVTGGWHEAPVPQISYHVSPGHFSYLAKEIKEKTGLKVIACNRINSLEIAEELLENGSCDFVGAARAFIADPDFAVKAKNGLLYNRCQGCNNCLERTLKKKDVQCSFNSLAGKEYLFTEPEKVKKIMIIGSGPAGLEAAYLAEKKGHSVIIVTDEMTFGGKLKAASKPLYKSDFIQYAVNKEYELKKCTKVFGTPISKELIDRYDPDAVIVAIGSDPIVPEIVGIEKIDHSTAEDVLLGKNVPKGKKVTVIGGGSVGLETAEFLASKYNKSVTVIEKYNKIGNGLGGLKWIMLKSLKEKGVEIKCKTEPVAICNGKLQIITEGKSDQIDSDMIVFAIGYKPKKCDIIIDYLQSLGKSYYCIGTCHTGKTIMDATSEAFNIVNNI